MELPPITPRKLRGFQDFPPETMIPRERLLQAAREVYRSYGFAPIDTPALEYAEVLLAKVEAGAEIGRQIYRFQHQRHDVALRFDLTVPFARFAAEHIATLGTPFKRYAMGSVWRGESPQAGRYREFMQCDFDTIGTTSNAADAEVALVIHDLLVALKFERFSVRVNNRRVLNGLLAGLGLTDQATPLLRALDKLPKVGRDAVVAEMCETGDGRAGATPEQACEVVSLAETTGTNAEVLDQLARRFAGNPAAAQGVADLRELVGVCRTAGVPESRLVVDVSICRGLDYYTGTVYETFLDDLPKIGSVCSGGRYDNLTGRYTKQSLPGVGASLGLDRLLAAMAELKHPWLENRQTPAAVLVVQFDRDRLGDYQRLGRTLRAAGIGAEVYPDPKKLGSQFQYAEKRGFRLALIAGSNEFAQGVVKVKDLEAREERTVPEPLLVETVVGMLAGRA